MPFPTGDQWTDMWEVIALDAATSPGYTHRPRRKRMESVRLTTRSYQTLPWDSRNPK